MIIKITKCTDDNEKTLEHWYKDMIGKEFEVADKTYNQFYYWVKYKREGKDCMNVINRNDAIESQ